MIHRFEVICYNDIMHWQSVKQLTLFEVSSFNLGVSYFNRAPLRLLSVPAANIKIVS